MASVSTTDQIASWGVVGAGGAGFPTHVKLAARVEAVVLNAAECEPLLHKDKELLRAYPDEVLAGLRIAGELSGAADVAIGIKGKYADVIELLKGKLADGMRIAPLADSYPTGDEFILVYDVTGRIVPPGGLPTQVGVLSINVETAFNVARGTPVVNKYLTVAGAVRRPVSICVPVGITLAEAIGLAGGSTAADPVALVGGAMMGRLARDLDEPVVKTTGGLIVLDREHPLARRYARTWDAVARIGASACDQCSFCTEFCPRYLLGHPIEPHRAMRSLVFNQVGEANVRGTQFCCECNICTMIACPEDLDPKAVCAQNKRRLAEMGQRWQVQANTTRARLHLDNRRVPISRLIRKLGLARYRNEGPLIEETVTPPRVVLPLKQHVGAPATPRVAVGDRVSAGDVVAAPAGDALGAVVHASIAGRVSEVSDRVVIEA